MANIGRPSKLTKELIKQFADMLPTVRYLETVGEVLGVSKVSWYSWIKRGNKALRQIAANRKLPKDKRVRLLEMDYLCIEFLNAHKKGVSMGVIKSLNKIDKDSSWQSQAWLLERRKPELWGSDRATVRALEKEVAEMRKVMLELQGNEGKTKPA